MTSILIELVLPLEVLVLIVELPTIFFSISSFFRSDTGPSSCRRRWRTRRKSGDDGGHLIVPTGAGGGPLGAVDGHLTDELVKALRVQLLADGADAGLRAWLLQLVVEDS